MMRSSFYSMSMGSAMDKDDFNDDSCEQEKLEKSKE